MDWLGRQGLQFAFLGPLVGAVSRAMTGWVSDKYGGGRVTFWTFLIATLAISGFCLNELGHCIANGRQAQKDALAATVGSGVQKVLRHDAATQTIEWRLLRLAL